MKVKINHLNILGKELIDNPQEILEFKYFSWQQNVEINNLLDLNFIIASC